ncbi:MAG: SpoIID/LytB domain-containing protein [Actinomycetota bacterium]
MRRAIALICLCLSAAVVAPAAGATSADDRIVLFGVGKAHGLGLAMDGVVGQGRAGWSADRILSLFYPGTDTTRTSGTIRVGLAEGATQSFVLPGGGSIPGAGAGGAPIAVAAGKRVTVVARNGRPVFRVDGAPASAPAASARPSPTPAVEGQVKVVAADPGVPLTSAPPVLVPTPPPTAAPASPRPERRAPAATPGSPSSIRIIPTGAPALVLVEATGKRYRGVMEVRSVGASLKVINHVDLETYVEGIAEARGAGWPIEAMKALAIAARSLGAASMSWYQKNQANGYDICPTQNCQVYFGYDGEESIMQRAVAETSGQIRTFSGRPILAMYHGNGGGQTESYNRAAGTQTSSHPYLRSVKYPHASPSTWRRDLTLTEIADALAARGTSVPGPLERIEVLERGDSPRVMRLGLHGGGRSTEVRGQTFAEALDLWSTWFEIRKAGSSPSAAFGPAGSSERPVLDRLGVGRDAGSTWILAFAAAFVALATAGALQATADRLPAVVRRRLRRPTPAPAPSARAP